MHHRQFSYYFPHRNQRVELGVKSANRVLRENVFSVQLQHPEHRQVQEGPPHTPQHS